LKVLILICEDIDRLANLQFLSLNKMSTAVLFSNFNRTIWGRKW